MTNTINERIKLRRTELGLTLLQLADYLGVKEATVQRYESGEIKNIKHETVQKLSEILRCTPAYLMGWDESTTTKREPTDLTEENIKVALFGGDGEVTDEMWDEVKNFAAYVKDKYKKGGK